MHQDVNTRTFHLYAYICLPIFNLVVNLNEVLCRGGEFKDIALHDS